jgi:hypothetical protein
VSPRLGPAAEPPAFTPLFLMGSPMPGLTIAPPPLPTSSDPSAVWEPLRRFDGSPMVAPLHLHAPQAHAAGMVTPGPPQAHAAGMVTPGPPQRDATASAAAAAIVPLGASFGTDSGMDMSGGSGTPASITMTVQRKRARFGTGTPSDAGAGVCVWLAAEGLCS